MGHEALRSSSRTLLSLFGAASEGVERSVRQLPMIKIMAWRCVIPDETQGAEGEEFRISSSPMSMFYKHQRVKVSTCWWLTGKGFVDRCWLAIRSKYAQRGPFIAVILCCCFPHLQVKKRYDWVKLAETHWVMPSKSSIMNQTSMCFASCTYIWHRLGWYPSAIDIHLRSLMLLFVQHGGVPNKALWTTLNNWQFVCNPFTFNLLVPSIIWEY